MFDYALEAKAWSITAENAEYRESTLRQELLATQISLENAEADTKRLDWAMPILTGEKGAVEVEHLYRQLLEGKTGREAIDGAMAA